MKVSDITFLKSVYKLGDLPKTGKFEIAFSGRSNVGKSSLINTILKRKGIAKTSSTPGRTQALNFIEINKAYYFVDLPGYGYAKVPVAVKNKWRHLIEGYLNNRPALRLIILIIDSRRDPRDDEAQFAEWLTLHGIEFMVVLTKIDKLKKSMQQRALNTWKKFLKLDYICTFSAVTGEGKEKIWRAIDLHLQCKQNT
jgi:GTP-binding protein